MSYIKIVLRTDVNGARIVVVTVDSQLAQSKGAKESMLRSGENTTHEALKCVVVLRCLQCR